jgi:hypothetical protein
VETAIPSALPITPPVTFPATDIAGDQLVADLIDAITAGAQTEDYLAARALGMTHNQLLEVIQATSHSSRPTRYTLPLTEYTAARLAGIIHNTAIRVHQNKSFVSLRLPTSHARQALKAGLSFSELSPPPRVAIRLTDYTRAILSGITPIEVVAAIARHMSIDHYIWARQAQVTHQELLEVADGPNFVHYCDCRVLGISHAETIDVFDHAAIVSEYLCIRLAGNTHQVALYKNGIHMRLGSHTHELNLARRVLDDVVAAKQLALERTARTNA